MHYKIQALQREKNQSQIIMKFKAFATKLCMKNDRQMRVYLYMYVKDVSNVN